MGNNEWTESGESGAGAVNEKSGSWGRDWCECARTYTLTPPTTKPGKVHGAFASRLNHKAAFTSTFYFLNIMFMPRGRLSVVHKASAVSSLTSLMNTGRRVVQTPGGLPGCPRHVVVGEEPSGLLKLRLDDVGVPLAPSSLQGTQLSVTSFFKSAFIWKCVRARLIYI